MSQSPAHDSTSKPPMQTVSSSSSNFNIIFEKALKEYKKKTRQRLTAHPLATQLDKCDSPAAILAILQDQVDQFDQSQSRDERLQRWLGPTINVLLAFTETLGEGISLAFSPAKVIFVGAGVLLQAAKDVEASQGILIDIFERIENFFRRLEVYTTVQPTPAMTDMMVKIIVEVLDILGIATKEMKQSRAKKFLKKIAGITKLEDGLNNLDRMTNEEARMASAEVLRLAHGIDNKVDVVEGKVQTIIDDGKQAAIEAQRIMQQTAHNVDVVKRRQLLESLRQWQSPSDPSTSHNFASDRQHEGTAEWFCRGSNFGEWKLAGSLLWIHGKPGSGKSILCSAIVNDIQVLQAAGLASMAYFYFDFRDVRKQSRGDLLRSLLIQLSASSDSFCDILSQLYDEYGKGTQQPSDNSLMRCLKEMLTLPNQRPVYLIMDALDECPSTSGIPSARERVLAVIKDLVDLRLSSLRLCVTSRPEVNIRNALEGIACRSVSLHEESGQKNDIAEYIKSVVHSPSDTLMKRWREDDKDLVIQTLSERADGMFRWVFCQLETLRHCLPRNISHVLSQLPATLDETYARMLKEIGKTNELYARRLLQCLTVAKRPLRVLELSVILTLDFEAEEQIPELRDDWQSTDEEYTITVLLSTCSSLIAVVGEQYNRVVQFAHFSVKEFLTSDRLATSSTDISQFHILPEPAHTVVAKACLATLLQSKFGFFLRLYAEDYWADHARFGTVWTRVEDGIRVLFDHSKPHLEEWIQRAGAQASRYFAGYYLFGHHGNPLYYASMCGLRDLAAHLISESPQHVTDQVGRNPSPLVAALRNRHFDIAELLLEHGANLGMRGDGNMTLLHAASEEGFADVVKWLFDHGVPDNSRQDSYETSLLTERDENWGHGISVDVADDTKNTPLHLASRGGVFEIGEYPEIVRELLVKGADVTARNRNHQTPLHLASGCWFDKVYSSPKKSSSMAETVRLLIRHGADINALDMTDSTPLHMASFSWTPEIVQILIESGAVVNVQNETHSTPLHRASFLGSPEIVQLLIEHGADVTALDWNHKTPLHLASSWDESILWPRLHRRVDPAKVDTIRLLIKHGADVTARDKTRSTPLHMVSSERSAESVRLLIEHGADVTVKNETRSTPLHTVSSWEDTDFMGKRSVAKVETVRLLIEHGADVTAEDGAFSTPLHMASSQGSFETVQLLIENGADIAARDASNRTPLHLASSHDDSRFKTYRKSLALNEPNAKANSVRLLIKHGADVSVRDKAHATPLHLAAFSGSSETVRLLLDHGADVTVVDGSHKTPLHMASSQYDGNGPQPNTGLFEEKAEVVRQLLEHGADVTVQDESYTTPLHLASSCGNLEIVRLLIEYGADVNAQDVSRRTPLHLASNWNDNFQCPQIQAMKVDAVKLLIDHGADVTAQDETYTTPLHLASSSGMPEIAQLLIKHGADVTARDKRIKTPLHLASSKYDSGIMQENPGKSEDKVKTVRLLIEHGADVKAQDEDGTTPLHMASSSEIAAIVWLLIEHGADARGRDRRQRTPLHMVSSWNDSNHLTNFPAKCHAKADTAGLLIHLGADLKAQDETQSTPLHLASSIGSAETVQLLIKHGADTNAQDRCGRTPLHMVSSREEGLDEKLRWKYINDKTDTVQLLLQHGADFTTHDDTHSTPLHLASSKGSVETVDLLIRHGANVNAQNGSKSTPLHLAASSHLALEGTIVRLLLSHGANIEVKDSEGRTPVEIASTAGNSWIEKLLSDHLRRG